MKIIEHLQVAISSFILTIMLGIVVLSFITILDENGHIIQQHVP